MVRVNLATGARHDIIGPAGRAVAYVPAHGKVLVERHPERAPPGEEAAADENEADGGGFLFGPIVPPEYRLVDPATGKAEPMGGEFAPFARVTHRPLQPTGNADEVWVAVHDNPYDDKETTTRIGRYDTRRFAFTEVLTLPGVRFTSMDVWVDEQAGLAYVALGEGDLLRAPLPAQSDGPQK